MISLEQMTNLIALSKTLLEATKGGIDLVATMRRYQADPATRKEAHEAQIILSTYSDDEINSIDGRLQNCRRQFEEQGYGEGRVKCICSALKHAKDGNGGDLPPVDAWQELWKQLKCATDKKRAGKTGFAN